MTIDVFSPRTKRISLYADFRKDLLQSPLTEDVALIKDEDAVKDSLRNLILTDRGERLMQPNLGSGIKELLFENLTPATLQLIKERVITTIETYEPRVELIDVSVGSTIDENQVQVVVRFYISNREQPVTLDVILERIR